MGKGGREEYNVIEWGWDVFEMQFGEKADSEGTKADEPCKTIIYKQPRVE